METFFTFLEKRVAECSSLLCVGLDPHQEELPAPTAEAAYDYCLQMIRNTAQFAAAFKPNAAFFEVFGEQGWAVLRAVVEAIGEESVRLGSRIPVILDAKRGDIASTSQVYAQSAFDVLRVDAITVNPYLGKDSIDPFLQYPEKGIFLLCKTSNPGSSDLQDKPIFGVPLFETVANLAQAWNQRDNIGLVVGATYPQAIRQVRKAAPDLWFLVPGVGTQGGNLSETLQAGLRTRGGGILLNVSRSLSRAPDPFRAAAELRDEMINVQFAMQKPVDKKFAGVSFDTHQTQIADGLLATGCVKFGEFKLKSGLISPIYIDLRRLVSYPQLLGIVGSAYIPILRTLHFNQLAALPYAAIPIATAISMLAGWPVVYPRKESKAYGTRAEIEGIFEPGDEAVIIDDLATTGESKFEAIDKLTQAGLQVKHIVVLIDRQSGARETLESSGFDFHAVFTLKELLDYWEAHQRVPPEQISSVRNFLAR
jgi:uridine monophosphate synthetase